MKKKLIPEIFVISTCHGEYAWMHTRLWHKLRYILVFEEVLELVKKTKFKWYIENYRTQLHTFLNNYPEKLKELRRYIKSGKIGICGDFTSIRPNMVGDETIIRNLIFGKEIFKKLFDINVKVNADYCDVSMWNSQMPQLLKLSGYKYILGGRPYQALELKGIPNEFIWIGLDGSEVICCRGGLIGINHPDDIGDYKNDWENSRKKILEKLEKRINENPFIPAYYISHGGDDTRPLRWGGDDSYVDILGFAEEWNKREKIPIKFGIPDEYFEKIEKIKAKLPKIKNVIDPCDVCFNVSFGGSKGLWLLRREIDRELVKTEIVSSIAKIYGFNYPEKEIENLWKDLLVICSHAIQWLFKDDFKRIYNKALYTKFKAEKIRFKAIEKIRDNIKFRKEDKVLIFNYLSFPVEKIVKVLLPFPEGSPSNFNIFDGKGKKLDYQIVNKMSGWGFKNLEYEIVTKIYLPPLGYNTIEVREKKKEKEESILKIKKYKNEIENKYIKIEFEKGRLKRIIDKKTGNSINSLNLNFYKVNTDFYLHVGRILNKKEIEWKNGEIEEFGPIRYLYKSEGKISSSPIILKTCVYRDEPIIEFEIEIDWRERNGFLTFETSLPFKGEIFVDIPFGIEERDLRKEPYDEAETTYMIERKRKGMFYGKSFVLFKEKNCNFVYISHNGDRYFISDERNLLKHILINSIDYEKKWEKDVNNLIKCKGLHNFKISYLFLKSAPLNKIIQKIMSIKNDVDIYYPLKENPGGELGKAGNFILLEPSNLILSSFYVKDGDYYLRIYETIGKKTRGFLKLPFVPKKVESVDFLGSPLKNAKIYNSKENVYFELNGWQILTLKIKKWEGGK